MIKFFAKILRETATEFKSTTTCFYSSYVNVIKDLLETGGNGNKSCISS